MTSRSEFQFWVSVLLGVSAPPLLAFIGLRLNSFWPARIDRTPPLSRRRVRSPTFFTRDQP